jgi:hypothetical protein
MTSDAKSGNGAFNVWIGFVFETSIISEDQLNYLWSVLCVFVSATPAPQVNGSWFKF